jgi:fructose-bisphosphate aldolase class II
MKGVKTMSFVTPLSIINDADKKGYAVPAFNAYNLETVTVVCNVALKLRAPVIIQIYRRLFYSDLGQYLSLIVKELSTTIDIPIALHLDHGNTEKDAILAIRNGCTGIMIDGSNLEWKENISLTSRIAAMCGYCGITCEGELGHVGLAADSSPDSAFTDPEQAGAFVKETGIDILAVMVGSAHGKYKSPPKLDIERIKKIKQVANVPLVLHGGSGIPDDEIKMAIKAGMCKINFATDICQAFYSQIRNLPSDDPIYEKAIDVFMGKTNSKIAQYVEEKIYLLGANHRY